MRPPRITPTIAQKIMSSTWVAFQVLPGRAAWRRASHHAAAKPITYMMPYQWIFTGPMASATASILGYEIIAKPILPANAREQGLQIARLGHGRMDRMIGRLTAGGDQCQLHAGTLRRRLQNRW